MKTKLLFEFLDLHRFTKSEVEDHDYIIDKMNNFAENYDLIISEEEYKMLAEKYELKFKELWNDK